MLLEKERERLLAVLQSRTASHQERDRARRTLEGELSLSEWPEDALAQVVAIRPSEPASTDAEAGQN
jgi:hypothetical protein